MNGEIKRKIDHLRDLLVGKIPVPTDQVKQITLGLIYKFMSDIDEQNRELGGSSFFSGDYQQYAWKHILDHSLSAYERVVLYSEGLEKMSLNPNIPQLFRDIFKGAFLPFKDPATVDQFLKGLNEFEYQHSEDLGDAYEYLLSIMGSQGDAGQFRTPRHIIDFIVAAVEPQKEDRVLDPACGTAGFLVSAYKYILKENTLPGSNRPGSTLSADERRKITENFVGYDISQDMMRISLVNMYLHQFTDPQIYEYDTLTSLDRWNDIFDCILTNPPFMSPSGGIRPHNRFGVHSNRSEVLFVDYIMEHLSPGGKAGVIVPEGIIFQSQNAYKQLRKKLVEAGYLYAVVSLPAGVFQPYSGVKTSILLLDRRLAQKAKAILFVKVEADGFDLGSQRRPAEKNDLPNVLVNILKYKTSLASGEKVEIDKSLFVAKEEIAKIGDYNFTVERYKKVQINAVQKWPLVELSDVSEINSGNSAPQDKWLFVNGKHNFFRTSDVGIVHISDNLIDSRDKLNEQGIKGLKLFSKNTLLFPKSGASTFLNHRAMLGVDGYVSSHLAVISPDPSKVLPKFLFNLLINVDAKTLTNDQNYPSLRLSDIEKIHIPLPPLEFQREIVAEIEGYQKIIDGARQVVDNWKPEIKVDSIWPRFKLSELIFEMKSGFACGQSDKNQNGLPHIRPMNISSSGVLVWEGTKYLNSQEFINKTEYSLKKKDVLFNNTNSKELVGKSCVLDHDIEGGYSNHITRIRVNNKELHPKFLAYVFYDYWKSGYFLELSHKWVGQAGINNQMLSELLIPTPRVNIQEDIVHDTEEQQKGVDACKKLIEIYEAKIKEIIGEVWGESDKFSL